MLIFFKIQQKLHTSLWVRDKYLMIWLKDPTWSGQLLYILLHFSHYYNHTGILAIPQTWRVCSYLRAFALAILSFWNLFLHLAMWFTTSSFKSAQILLFSVRPSLTFLDKIILPPALSTFSLFCSFHCIYFTYDIILQLILHTLLIPTKWGNFFYS